jgi:hypothetical protein
MTVGIIAGAEGTGKTSQLVTIAQAFTPSVWGILELKDEEKITALKTDEFLPSLLFEMYEDGSEYQANEDPVRTLDKVRKWRDNILNQKPLPATIVLDGISDLRDYAILDWVIRDNKKRLSGGKEPRESIGEKNLGAWGAVNETVKKILNPLINTALKKHINFFMTAQMKDRYLNGDIVGMIPDLKSYMSYPVPCLFILSYEGSYNIECTKEPVTPRWEIKDIKKDIGMLEAFRAHDLIRKEPVDFMIDYEMAGEEVRTFIKAIDATEAEKKLKALHPPAIIKGVTK